MSSEALEQIWKDVAYAGLRKGSFVRGGGVETVARRHVEFNMEATVVSGVTPFAVECTKGSTERRGYRTIPDISKSRTKKPSSTSALCSLYLVRGRSSFTGTTSLNAYIV